MKTRKIAVPMLAVAFVLVASMALTVPRTSSAGTQYTPHDVIRISSDADLAVGRNGITAGSGTSSDPFLISGWHIGQEGGSSGIEIWNTRADIKITHMNISFCNIGILLYNVSDVSIRNTMFYQNTLGLSIQYSHGCKVSDCTFQENYFGVTIKFSVVSRSGNDYIGNTENLIETKTPWEQGWLGTLVCAVVLVPLSVAVGLALYIRMKNKPKAPPGIP